MQSRMTWQNSHIVLFNFADRASRAPLMPHVSNHVLIGWGSNKSSAAKEKLLAIYFLVGAGDGVKEMRGVGDGGVADPRGNGVGVKAPLGKGCGEPDAWIVGVTLGTTLGVGDGVGGAGV